MANRVMTQKISSSEPDPILPEVWSPLHTEGMSRLRCAEQKAATVDWHNRDRDHRWVRRDPIEDPNYETCEDSGIERQENRFGPQPCSNAANGVSA
jgi:hypothetical protein